MNTHRHALLGLTATLTLATAACDAPSVASEAPAATEATQLVQLRGRTARDLLVSLRFIDIVLEGDFGDGPVFMKVWNESWQGREYQSHGLFTESPWGTVEVLRCSAPVGDATYIHEVGCQLYGVASQKETYDGLEVSGDEASGAGALAQLLHTVPAEIPGVSCDVVEGDHEWDGYTDCFFHDEAWLELDWDLGVYDVDSIPTVHVEGELAETVFRLLVASGEIDHEGPIEDLYEATVGPISCARVPNAMCELTTDEVNYDLYDAAIGVMLTNGFSTGSEMPSDILFGVMKLLAEEGSELVVNDSFEDGFAFTAGGWSCWSYLGETPVCEVVPMSDAGTN